MNHEKSNSKQLICAGTGLVALDLVVTESKKGAELLAGGSCGNVLTILSYFGWESYPIARLSNSNASDLLLEDLRRWRVREDLLTFTDDGSTPIIIHRILKDKNGKSKHRFEFRNPENGKYLPAYKPCLAKSVDDIVAKSPIPDLFYFDRVNRGSIDLAKRYQDQGSVIFFEPSSFKVDKNFQECLQIADIVKFSDERIANYDSIFPEAQANLEIQTQGESGLRYRRKGRSHWASLQGFSNINVVDTAGAGDWCTAGLIFKLFLNRETKTQSVGDGDIRAGLELGQVLSALNCSFEGARGLMYHFDSDELLEIANNILDEGKRDVHVSQFMQHEVLTSVRESSFNISSLIN